MLRRLLPLFVKRAGLPTGYRRVKGFTCYRVLEVKGIFLYSETIYFLAYFSFYLYFYFTLFLQLQLTGKALLKITLRG